MAIPEEHYRLPDVDGPAIREAIRALPLAVTTPTYPCLTCGQEMYSVRLGRLINERSVVRNGEVMLVECVECYQKRQQQDIDNRAREAAEQAAKVAAKRAALLVDRRAVSRFYIAEFPKPAPFPEPEPPDNRAWSLHSLTVAPFGEKHHDKQTYLIVYIWELPQNQGKHAES